MARSPATGPGAAAARKSRAAAAAAAPTAAGKKRRQPATEAAAAPALEPVPAAGDPPALAAVVEDAEADPLAVAPAGRQPAARAAGVPQRSSISTRDAIRQALSRGGRPATPVHRTTPRLEPVAFCDDPLALHATAPSTTGGGGVGGAAIGPRPDPDGDATRDPTRLLQQADSFFSNLKRKEKTINARAHGRLREMKAANRNGGDNDGFKYVIPKSVKAMASVMRKEEGLSDLPEGADAGAGDKGRLETVFGAEGVEDAVRDDKPMRKRKQRGNFMRADFYQHQVRERWTANAERFLARGRAGRAFFSSMSGGIGGGAGGVAAGKKQRPHRNATKTL